jgi:hypothetical protein
MGPPAARIGPSGSRRRGGSSPAVPAGSGYLAPRMLSPTQAWEAVLAQCRAGKCPRRGQVRLLAWDSAAEVRDLAGQRVVEKQLGGEAGIRAESENRFGPRLCHWSLTRSCALPAGSPRTRCGRSLTSPRPRGSPARDDLREMHEHAGDPVASGTGLRARPAGRPARSPLSAERRIGRQARRPRRYCRPAVRRRFWWMSRGRRVRAR